MPHRLVDVDAAHIDEYAACFLGEKLYFGFITSVFRILGFWVSSGGVHMM
jgi:hypothetical protein